MEIRRYTEDEEQLVHDICYGCGSAMSKRMYAYIRTARWYAKKSKSISFVGYVFGYVGFYCGLLMARDFRLIAFAVLEEHQGKGIGKAMLEHLKAMAAGHGAQRIVFKTESGSAAFAWWIKRGACPVRAVGGEVEMEVRL